MGRQRTAVVVGAGPAGLAAAIALGRAGFAVRVYERRTGTGPAPWPDGGTGLTLWPNGLAALASFHADQPVRDSALAAPGTVMRAKSGRVLCELSGPSLDAIGGRGVALRRADLLAALAGLLPDGTLRLGVRCAGVRAGRDQAVARFDDDTEAAADLLIGADGIRSAVRTACGIPARLDYGGVVVWRAAVPFPLPPSPGLLTFGGPCQFGIWGLPGGQVYWFASAPAPEGTEPGGTARRSGSRPPRLFGDWHEPIGPLLAATRTDLITVTGIYDCRPLPAWSSGRVVLIGDAAHPSLPHMGQGTSQAFEDVAVLADSLAGQADIDAALLDYEARRRPRANSAWSQARALARIGGWHGRPAVWLRERMLSGTPERAQLAQLRRLFAFSASPGNGTGITATTEKSGGRDGPYIRPYKKVRPP